MTQSGLSHYARCVACSVSMSHRIGTSAVCSRSRPMLIDADLKQPSACKPHVSLSAGSSQIPTSFPARQHAPQANTHGPFPLPPPTHLNSDSRARATRVAKLLTGYPRPFVLYFSLGSVLSICSSFFLTGPWKQVKKMFAPSRAVATSVYLITLALTLFVALSPYASVPGRGIILLCLVAVQFLSYVWYTLSYVPFARRFMSGFWSGLRGRG